MNVFLLQDVLSQRYNTCYTQLRNKLTTLSKQGPLCSTNTHSSRPVGHSMQKSLKLKLQNAVNQLPFSDGGTPALFVGGRRRNRKKRKNKNGQNKRKNKQESGQEVPLFLTSLTPDFEYYDDYVPRKPTVSCLDLQEPVFIYETTQNKQSCLDIEEPVFIYEPSQNKQMVITDPDKDSLYSSRESLESSKSRRDSGCEEGSKLSDDSDSDDNTNSQQTDTEDPRPEKLGYPRTHSRDSGVYDDLDDTDDTSVDDAGFYDDNVEDSLTSAVTDNNLGSSIKDELAEAEAVLVSPTKDEKNINDFEEINLTEDDDHTDSTTVPTEEPVVQNEVRIITDIDHLSDSDHFLNIADDDDDIIFDISQLELNTTQDDISNIGKENFQLKKNGGSIFYPTDLEEGPLEQLPMDMLIEDDKDDEVLFEASPRRELSITCNPLYEQSIRDEEERVSIKSYQDGFKTNFDSVNYIKIPGTASNKAKKESSPLLKSQDKDDELACCIIL